ncbi:MAG: DNA primase [Candidatus Omnitrophica bacterium]|nr:DNA primase [Candidatus Omnitrophota bacterium]
MAKDPVVQEVLARTDIVDLIGSAVRLKKSGRTFKGLCPFHSEKTPSFHVYPNDGTREGFYYCFGCHAKGDALRFLMDRESLTFPEALEQLATRAGVELKRHSGPSREKRQSRFEVLAICQAHFRSNLRHPEKGARARDYLEGRDMGGDVIDRFGLGFGLDQWDGLVSVLGRDRENLSMAASLGMIRQREQSGGYYDFFRNRLMFPIFGTSGQIIAFAGRDLSGEVGAKYMNTPESDLFKKSRVLYGLHSAREKIRETGQAILVEGYFDVIRMQISGFENTVAPMGTAATPEQFEMLERMAEEIILLFDGDSAGMQAAVRSLGLIWNLKCPVRIAHLPQGQDPDDFLRARGPSDMETLLSEAKSGFTYLVDHFVGLHGKSSAEQIQKVVEAVFESIAEMESRVQVEVRLKELSEKIGVPFDSLRQDWNRVQADRRAKQGPISTAASAPQSGSQAIPRRSASSPVGDAMKGILSLILMDQGELEKAMGSTFSKHPKVGEYLNEALATFEKTAQNTLLAPLIRTFLDQGPEQARNAWESGENLDERWAIEADMRRREVPRDPLRSLRDYTQTLKKSLIQKHLTDCRMALKAAEESQNWEQVGALAAQVDRLISEREAIYSESTEEVR